MPCRVCISVTATVASFCPGDFHISFVLPSLFWLLQNIAGNFKIILVDVSDMFCFCCDRGRGRGSLRRQKGGVVFLLKIPGKGGSPRREGGGRRAGRVLAGNWGGMGLKCFFGAEIPTM